MRAETAQQLFAGIRRQQRAGELAGLAQQSGRNEQRDQEQEQSGVRLFDALRQKGGQDAGKGAAPDDIVQGNLERQRNEQGQRRSQQTQQENAGEITPIRPHLLAQPPIERQILKPGRHIFPLFQFF